MFTSLPEIDGLSIFICDLSDVECFDYYAAQEWIIDTKLNTFATNNTVNSYNKEITQLQSLRL